MTANEATRLLPASEIETDDWSEQTVEGPPVHKGLELWQLGAFGGKHPQFATPVKLTDIDRI